MSCKSNSDSEGDASKTSKDAYLVAVREGQDEADQQVKDGNPVIYTFGLAPQSGFDPKTKLPLVPIKGCGVAATDFGRINGHNERIRELWMQGKLNLTVR